MIFLQLFRFCFVFGLRSTELLVSDYSHNKKSQNKSMNNNVNEFRLAYRRKEPRKLTDEHEHGVKAVQSKTAEKKDRLFLRQNRQHDGKNKENKDNGNRRRFRKFTPELGEKGRIL